MGPLATSVIQGEWAEYDPRVAHLVVLVSVLAVWLWDSIDGWRKTLRHP